MSFIMFTSRSGIFLTVLSYVLLGNEITAEKVFVITSYYMILRQTMTVYFPQGVVLVSYILHIYSLINQKICLFFLTNIFSNTL